MRYILFDEAQRWKQLLPLTFTRPLSLLRVGIFTGLERWQNHLGAAVEIYTVPELQTLWKNPNQGEAVWINAAWLPKAEDVDLVASLGQNEFLSDKSGQILAYRSEQGPDHEKGKPSRLKVLDDVHLINHAWDIFSQNGWAIRQDFGWIKAHKSSHGIQDPFTHAYHTSNIFIEEGVSIKAAILNAEDGPIYIGKAAQIQEGAMIKGPCAILEHAVVNMGAKIRPDCTIGPFCKVGGELNNAVLFGYSNKAHDGFLGNSVIGEWCNLGADTNNSNLKNNYGKVKAYSYQAAELIDTNLLFCGLIMGDHSRSGINAMFNTGTVVGVGCNIFDAGFPPKHIPNFSWGSALSGFQLYDFEKFIEVETRVYARRSQILDPSYISYLKMLHDKAKLNF